MVDRLQTAGQRAIAAPLPLMRRDRPDVFTRTASHPLAPQVAPLLKDLVLLTVSLYLLHQDAVQMIEAQKRN